MRPTINAHTAFALLLSSSLSYISSLLFVPVGFSVGITDSGYYNQLLIIGIYIFFDFTIFIVTKENKFWTKPKFFSSTSNTIP
jgi:hypothetical protein